MPQAEEMVMAVATAELFEPGYFQGLKVGGGAWLERLFDPQRTRFLPRSEAEHDPNWKQIIPYVVLLAGERVFTYRRGMKSSESRLRALHAIGLGGHIRHTDDTLFTPPGRPAYDAGLERELGEEVAIAAPTIDDRLVGLINDDTVEVGRVHVGVLHLRRLESDAVLARESKIAAGRFAPVEELCGAGAPELETWSRLCLDAWATLLAQPGWEPSR